MGVMKSIYFDNAPLPVCPQGLLTKGRPGALRNAEALSESLEAWAADMGRRYAPYRDLVQPLQTAAAEVQYGLSTLCGVRSIESSRGKTFATPVARAMVYPAVLSAPLDGEALEQLLGLFGAGDQHPGSGVSSKKLKDRLELLLVALNGHVRWLQTLHALGADMTREKTWLEIGRTFDAFVKVWNDIEAESQRLEEERAQTFKLKSKDIQMSIDDRADEDAFQEAFPDERRAFADLEATEPELDIPEIDLAEQEQLAEQKAAYALVRTIRSQMVNRLVAMYAQLFGAKEGSPSRTTTEYLQCYMAGQALASKVGLLPSQFDADVYGGHAVAIAETHASLTKKAASLVDVDHFDIREAHPEEAMLLREPVKAVETRLLGLLQEWPDHILLVQVCFSAHA